MKENLIAYGYVERKIIQIRGQRVILDFDLAELYDVETRRLKEQIKRNERRFPPDFGFQITWKEREEVVAICDNLGKLKYSPVLPYAFTEYGAIMAATVLNSERAVEMSVFVVRAFVKLREMLIQSKDLSHKLADLESRIGTHDEAIRSLFDAIRQLMTPPKKEKKPVGFVTEK